ncbi:MAG: hypothetical protein WCF84_18705 [Anaerolineae bacterium]
MPKPVTDKTARSKHNRWFTGQKVQVRATGQVYWKLATVVGMNFKNGRVKVMLQGGRMITVAGNYVKEA